MWHTLIELSFILLYLYLFFFTFQGSLQIFTGLGLILGPPFGGWMYQAAGYELPFMVLGCVLLLMVPFNFFVMPSCGEGLTYKTCPFKGGPVIMPPDASVIRRYQPLPGRTGHVIYCA